MPFLGKQPSVGAYSKLDSITTSATTTFNLSLDGGAYYPQSANHLLVSLNGIIQAPQDSFTVSGSQIIFSSALTVSDSIDFIIALGDVLDIGTPTAGTVGTSQLANSAVTTAKIADDQITSAKLANAINITSGNSLTIDSGATITNNGTATGFGSPAYTANASASTGAVNVDASDNLQFNSGYGSTATAYGCRAWVYFNGTGTLAINGSGGVSSVTDSSTGQYVVNFSQTMPDTNFAIFGHLSTYAIGGNYGEAWENNSVARTTTSVGIRVALQAGGSYDHEDVMVGVFR